MRIGPSSHRSRRRVTSPSVDRDAARGARPPSPKGLGPPAVFVGRTEEVRRLGTLLRRVRTAVVYGLAGVGKSALVAAVAARYRGLVIHRRIVPGDTLDTVVDDARRQLREAPVAQALSDASRLEDLARELESRRALCVLDDLHALAPEARSALLEGLGGRLRHGALLATSREVVPRHAASPDRIELRLDGLPESAARMLWRQLDQLYGAREGFAAAWARSRGVPFLLRRAHANDADVEEPVRAALSALPPDERKLAAVLALSEVPLPAASLGAVLPGGAAEVALARLGARLLVEADAQGRQGVHDLVREALQSLLGEREARDAHETLLAVLAREPLPEVVRVRAMCRHLQALGRHAERVAFVIEQAEALVRQGAAGELLALLGSVPEPLRTPHVGLARARALVRLLDLRRAYAELLALSSSLGEASDDEGLALREQVGTVLVRVALFSLELDACERTLGAMPMPRDPEVFLQQLLAWAALRFFQGRLDESLEMLGAACAATNDPRVLGWCAYARALMCWIDGRDDELEAPLSQCLSLLGGEPLHSRGPLVAAMSAGIVSRLGRFEAAETALAGVRERLEELGAPRLALELDCIAALVRGERGERRAALAGLRQTEARAEQGGYLFVHHLSRVCAGRMLLELGRRAEGLALLDEAAASARARGAEGLARGADAARASDVQRQLERAVDVEPREVRPGVAARQRALAALAAATAGDSVRAAGLLASLRPLAVGADFAMERALAHLAHAMLHRLAGRATDTRDALEAAARAAAEGEADPELVPELARSLASLRVVTSSGARLATEAPAAQDAVVLDARHHELRVGGRTHSLAKRVLPRRLLYALARQPGKTLSKEACVRAMWEADYDPRLHDNSLRVHVRHLRELLEGSGARLVFEDPGYRLEVAEGFAFVRDESTSG
ncbi:winged helix-turn-helix domain-containing protein [Myxococcus sp. K15C18031901]|uniref:winged helix-turn-helix domain-containing protein n=1 Tax=Myxococcus dinghuensis TaxID=2906761 RepID=UPI0020A823A6|nr:winged helix-turn-helix domain-containing protein [Myxococcus dinghuensis]MCP3104683.1 winged helix-turn-helix domain-containing protein [Myxococcus dinghuensis]